MRISIVTINFNKRAGLRRTLASLRGQTDRDFELIVIDGGSTDGSQQEIEAFRDIIHDAVSERDSGIFDAWNKGIRRANGEVIALLNSGDAYHPEFIATARACIESSGQPIGRRIFCGNTVTLENGAVLKFYGNQLRRVLWFGIGVVHPGMFVGREVYDTVGLYHPISIASDTDWVLRCVRQGVRFEPMNALVYMEAGGVSATQAVKAFSQYTEALARHRFCRPFTARQLSWSYAVYRWLRKVA
jgi:glycosyltransferase involved in cell wall biosynthesis